MPAKSTAANVQELIGVLRDDVAARADQMSEMNALLEERNRLLQEQNEATRREMTERLSAQDKQGGRYRWYTGLLGVVAVVVGAWVMTIIVSITDDMDKMRLYMQNMGEERGPHANPSYMQSMASNMSTMRGDMQAMRISMGDMDGSMGQMSGDMKAMKKSMGTMQGDITVMSSSMGNMSQDVAQMNGSMGSMTQSIQRMNYDTAVMRTGVANMSSDTNAMGQPFRAMDAVMPW